MHTVIRGAHVLAESWERAEAWVPFAELVVEAGTQRSFARFPSEESAAPVAQRFGGRTGEVLVQRGGRKFEIVLSRPPEPPRRHQFQPPPEAVRASGRPGG